MGSADSCDLRYRTGAEISKADNQRCCFSEDLLKKEIKPFLLQVLESIFLSSKMRNS